jgi:hypothetical protein
MKIPIISNLRDFINLKIGKFSFVTFDENFTYIILESINNYRGTIPDDINEVLSANTETIDSLLDLPTFFGDFLEKARIANVKIIVSDCYYNPDNKEICIVYYICVPAPITPHTENSL